MKGFQVSEHFLVNLYLGIVEHKSKRHFMRVELSILHAEVFESFNYNMHFWHFSVFVHISTECEKERSISGRPFTCDHPLLNFMNIFHFRYLDHWREAILRYYLPSCTLFYELFLRRKNSHQSWLDFNVQVIIIVSFQTFRMETYCKEILVEFVFNLAL